MIEYAATWVIVAVLSIIILTTFYECLHARWKRREKDIEKFKKKLDLPIQSNGSPLRKQRKAFIQV